LAIWRETEEERSWGSVFRKARIVRAAFGGEGAEDSDRLASRKGIAAVDRDQERKRKARKRAEQQTKKNQLAFAAQINGGKQPDSEGKSLSRWRAG